MEQAENSKYGFNIWTKNSPKPYIDLFSQYAIKHETPIEAVVDDVLAAAVFQRTPVQTKEMNKKYQDYMLNAGFDTVSFVSEMLPDRERDLERVYRASGKITLSEFVSALPEHKRLSQSEIGLSEIIDPCWQLEVLSAGIAKNGIKTYLTGKRSLALFRLAKENIENFDFEVIDE